MSDQVTREELHAVVDPMETRLTRACARLSRAERDLDSEIDAVRRLIYRLADGLAQVGEEVRR